jgi:integrase
MSRKLKKVPGYVGLYYEDSVAETRIAGKVKPDRSYYARYKKNGRPHKDYLGRQSEGLTDAQAANLRQNLIAGVPIKNQSNRKRKKAKPKKQSADDYIIEDAEGRPEDYWTLQNLFDYYVKLQGNNYSNKASDKNNFKNHLAPLVGHLRPKDITPLKVKQVRAVLREKTPIHAGTRSALQSAKKRVEKYQAEMETATDKKDREKIKRRSLKDKNRVREIETRIARNKNKLSAGSVKNAMELLRRISYFGDRCDLCPRPPKIIEVEDVDNEKAEDLSPEQIARLMRACDTDPNQEAADMIRIALSTGLRRGSILQMTWRNVNFQKKVILIRASKKGERHSKSGRQIPIQMSPFCEKILRTRAAVADRKLSDYVFPGRDGNKRPESPKAVKRIVRAAGIPDDFRPLHGVRCAFASNLANTGDVDLYMIGQMLGHSRHSIKQTQRYAHLRNTALKRSTDIMSDIIERAVAGHENGEDGDKETA